VLSVPDVPLLLELPLVPAAPAALPMPVVPVVPLLPVAAVLDDGLALCFLVRFLAFFLVPWVDLVASELPDESLAWVALSCSARCSTAAALAGSVLMVTSLDVELWAKVALVMPAIESKMTR
jgi:hypothetical protein